jgi:hypothetical protein
MRVILANNRSRRWYDCVSRPLEAVVKKSGNNTDGLVKSGVVVFADS